MGDEIHFLHEPMMGAMQFLYCNGEDTCLLLSDDESDQDEDEGSIEDLKIKDEEDEAVVNADPWWNFSAAFAEVDRVIEAPALPTNTSSPSLSAESCASLVTVPAWETFETGNGFKSSNPSETGNGFKSSNPFAAGNGFKHTNPFATCNKFKSTNPFATGNPFSWDSYEPACDSLGNMEIEVLSLKRRLDISNELRTIERRARSRKPGECIIF